MTATRTSLSTMPLARMAGHRKGYRVLNGDTPGMSPQEQEFRYRMHELSGEAQQLGQCVEDTPAYSAGQQDLWNHIAGLHGCMQHTSRMDIMLTQLMLVRKVWKLKVMPPAELAVLRECLNRMASEPHTMDLTVALGHRLCDAGVDVKMGF